MELEPRTYTVLLPMVWAVCACVIHVRSMIFFSHQKIVYEYSTLVYRLYGLCRLSLTLYRVWLTAFYIAYTDHCMVDGVLTLYINTVKYNFVHGSWRSPFRQNSSVSVQMGH